MAITDARGRRHKTPIVKGALESVRVDQIYDQERLIVYVECVPCPLYSAARVRLGGRSWFVTDAFSVDGIAVMTLSRARLACPERVRLYEWETQHGCDLPAQPTSVGSVCTYWQQIKSEERIVNDASVWFAQWRVVVESDRLAEMLSRQVILVRNGVAYEVESVEGAYAPDRLPVAVVHELTTNPWRQVDG